MGSKVLGEKAIKLFFGKIVVDTYPKLGFHLKLK